MAVLIDPPSWPAHGRLWSHLASDTSYDELHAFAERWALPRRAFEGDHYDVPADRYDALVSAGALPVASRDLLGALQRSGLRRPKRKGERVIASEAAPDGRWWDLIASRLAAPVPAPVVVLAQRSSSRGVEVLAGDATGAWDLLPPDLAEIAGADLSAARPCGHERTSPLRAAGPDLSRATWRTVLRADVAPSAPVPDGLRWLAAADVGATPPRWWPLVEWLAARS
ncbi:MAG: DUF4031 domain-containing protein [Angustibacter sp.]